MTMNEAFFVANTPHKRTVKLPEALPIAPELLPDFRQRSAPLARPGWIASICTRCCTSMDWRL